MGRDERLNPAGTLGGPQLFGPGGGRITSQPAEVQDGFGRVLHPGDLIQVQVGGPVFFRVQEIKKVVESGVPEGLMEIVIMAVLKFRAPRSQPQAEFVRILTAEETGSSKGQPSYPQADGDDGQRDAVEAALARKKDQELPL